MEITKDSDLQVENLEQNAENKTVELTDSKDALKEEYLAYIAEIEKNRLNYTTQQEIIDAVSTLCKVLSLTTVVPKTELKNIGDTRQPVIIGGTHIDLVKSQYPGLYPVLLQRLLDLSSKL